MDHYHTVGDEHVIESRPLDPRHRTGGRIVVPGTDVPVLSWNTQMPGPSFSLPARQTCPGASLVPGLGSCVDCIVFERGRYRSKLIKHQQQVRKKWVEHSLKTSMGTEIMVRTLVAAIGLTRDTLFRAHDAGDVFDASYAHAWEMVCHGLADVKFWFPTRSWVVPDILPALRDLARLPNVSVRPSAAIVGGPPPRVTGLSAGTLQYENVDQVPHGVWVCPATSQNNQCGTCTACWTLKDTPIAFEKR